MLCGSKIRYYGYDYVYTLYRYIDRCIHREKDRETALRESNENKFIILANPEISDSRLDKGRNASLLSRKRLALGLILLWTF